jgi:hypothetical protein
MLMIIAFAWERRRSRVAWVLIICLLIPAVASLGKTLIFRGHAPGVWLPWDLVDDLPVLRYALPVRFSMFVALAAALIGALWLTRGGWLRWALVALVVVSLAPDVNDDDWHTSIADPAFFETGEHRRYLKSEDRVITVPTLGANERWHAKADLGFKLAGGYLGTRFPSAYTRYPTWTTLASGRLTPDYAAQLRRFVRDKGVTAIVVDKRADGPWRKLFDSLGTRPLDTGGVLLYRLHPPGGA